MELHRGPLRRRLSEALQKGGPSGITVDTGPGVLHYHLPQSRISAYHRPIQPLEGFIGSPLERQNVQAVL